MRNNRRRTKRKMMAEINVVPYIDVMLVLLIIFMITTPLLTQGVKVNLPKAKTQSITDQQLPAIVTVDRMGQYFVNISPTPEVAVAAEQMVNLISADLLSAQQKNQALPVYVKGDKDADYGKVMSVMALLQQAGVGTVGLLTQSADEVSHGETP